MYRKKNLSTVPVLFWLIKTLFFFWCCLSFLRLVIACLKRSLSDVMCLSSSNVRLILCLMLPYQDVSPSITSFAFSFPFDMSCRRKHILPDYCRRMCPVNLWKYWNKYHYGFGTQRKSVAYKNEWFA